MRESTALELQKMGWDLKKFAKGLENIRRNWKLKMSKSRLYCT